MSDKIFITGLSLHAYHGVMPFEGKVGQTFTIDLALSIDLAAAARSDKVADTVSYDKVVECASAAFCAQKLQADRGRRRPRRRRGAGGIPARAQDRGDNPQAARADRRHLQRRRRHADARRGAAPNHDRGVARARRQCRRQPRDSRPRRGAAVRRHHRHADSAFRRLPHAALGLQISAALRQPVHRGRDHASPARALGACAGGRTAARPRPRA